MIEYKRCTRCKIPKPLTTDYWYPIAARKGHKKPGWQSYCKTCWKDINKANKAKRKLPV